MVDKFLIREEIPTYNYVIISGILQKTLRDKIIELLERYSENDVDKGLELFVDLLGETKKGL